MLLAGAHGVLEETAQLLEHLAAGLELRRHGLKGRPHLSHHHGNRVLLTRLTKGREPDSRSHERKSEVSQQDGLEKSENH